MMDNMVTMSLEKYTELILENNNLKNALHRYNKKLEADITEHIYTSKIENIKTKEDVELWFLKTDAAILDEFSENYDWRWRDIAETYYGTTSLKETKEKAVAIIKQLLNERLQYFIDKETD